MEVTTSSLINSQTNTKFKTIKHSIRRDPIAKDNFKALQQAVLSRKPILREILEKRGQKTLAEYSRDYIDVNHGSYLPERQNQLISAITYEVERTLGGDVARSVSGQLKKYFFVSTADHFGPICHPFFVNSNLMVSAGYPSDPDSVLRNIVVLSCSNISFDNSSFPRGLSFHTVAPDGLRLEQLPFFPRSVRPCPVFNFRAFTAQSIQNIEKTLADFLRKGVVNKHVYERLSALISSVYSQRDVLEYAYFNDQVVKTNFALWKEFFNGQKDELPNLVYVEQETLVANLLQAHHLSQDTIISRILFKDEYRTLVEKYFDGIMGGFTLATKTGTYLFWALPPGRKYREQLWRQGNVLSTSDGTYKVELTPESIAAALLAKEIFPSTLLSFLLLAFHYGLKLLGGFNQVNYLTFMKEAFIKLATDIGDMESVRRSELLQTKELIDAPTVAFARGPKNELIPATGLDLYLYGNGETVPALRRTMLNLTLDDALEPLLPDIYRVVYPEPERQQFLSSITAEDITCLLRIDAKEEPCVIIH
ncbi:MAG: hypothetical protein AAB408_00760 [Patescibacteria group bacterium]